MLQKKLTVFTLLFLLAFTANAQLKIGFMNPQEAMESLPERDSVEQELNAFIEQKRGELEKRTADFQQQASEFQQNAESMSEEKRRQEEQRLTQLQNELQQYQNNMRSQIQRKQAEMLEPLLQRVDEAIASVSEEMGLDFVLNEKTSSGSNVLFYSSGSKANDITQKVIEKLNSN